jgi:hypothetical protein
MSTTSSSGKEVAVASAPNDTIVDAVRAWNSRVGTIGATNGDVDIDAFEEEVAEEVAKETTETIEAHDGSLARLGARQEDTADLAQVDGDTVDSMYDEVFAALDVPEARQSTQGECVTDEGNYVETSKVGLGGTNIGRRNAEEARFDRETDVAIDGSWGGAGDDSSVPEGKTLYTQERIASREWELEHIRTVRTSDDQTEIETGWSIEDRSMHDLRTHARQTVLTVADRYGPDQTIEQTMMVVGNHPEDTIDPRARLGQVSSTALGAVNKHAATLAEDYDLSPAVLSKAIAERITSGTPGVRDVIRAISTVRERLNEAPAVVSPINEIDPDTERVSVAGTVSQLFHPNDINSQLQVAYVDDGTASAKVTVWRKSDPDTLFHEEDEVIIKAASPGTYKGRPTLAIRHDSLMIVTEEGNGPAKASRAPEQRSASTPQCREQVPGSLTPSLGSSEPVPRPEHDRRNHIEEMVYLPETVPEWFPYRPDVRSLETTSLSDPQADGQGAYGIIARQRYERGGVSWADKKRREAKKEGRKRRLKEKKYGQKWYETGTQRANDEYYRWKLNKQFGADERIIHADLPWPGRERAAIPTLTDAGGHLDS